VSAARCIGEPISWLRLETHALAHDAKVASHLAACPACSACFAEITGDLVALPPLVVPDVPERARRRWLPWLGPAMAAAAAAIVLLVIVRRDPGGEPPGHVTAVKGAGEIVLGIVRERAGTIRSDVATFLPGDRFKVTLTCAPGAYLWADVAVVDPAGVDYPLGGPQQVACGNQVALTGAFSITGRELNRVCVRLDALVPPARTTPNAGEPGVACVTLSPE
jgi:hypothetical protein